MKKSEQIAALKVECDRLAKERDQLARCLSAERAKTQRLINARPVPLTDRVRSEFAERCGWLGDLVGL